MVRIWNIFGLAVLFLVVLSACDRGTFDRERSAAQGSLMARLHTLPGTSKAEQVELDVPPIDAFVVSVCSVSVATPVYSSLYSAFPYSLNLTEGSYTIEAAHGQNVPFTTEDPYYFVQQPFEIARGEATSVELKARLVGFGVEGFFDADMADHFVSWRLEAEIDQVWDASYRWAEQGEKPRAYFLPGTVRVILRGVRHNGAVFSQVIKEINSPLGRELYTLNIHVLPAGHALSVRVDTERRVVTDQGVVSVDALPDLEAPVLGAMTFYETTTVAAEGLAATAELRSFVGFSEVTITAPRAGYGLEARAYRWSDGADRAALRAAGVDLGANDLSNSRTATLSAKGLVGAMLADASVEREYNLAVAVTDGTGKVGVSTLPILIERPEFTLPTEIAGCVWSKSLDLPAPVVVQGDQTGLLAHVAFGYEWSADGATWQVVSSATSLTGLEAGTQYYVRARFRDQTTAAVAFTTETPTQVPNADFSTYHTANGKDGNAFANYGSQFEFFPSGSSAESKWWGTLNELTCEKSPATAYWYTSRSFSRPTTGSNGNGVYIITGGYGYGSVTGSTKKTAQGELYLGISNIKGKPFKTKPTAVVFDYKYNPYQNDISDIYVVVENRTVDVVIGRGELQQANAVGSYVRHTMDIVYNENQVLYAPTHLTIVFRSGFNTSLRKMSSGDVQMVGSELWVDEVSLIYDK